MTNFRHLHFCVLALLMHIGCVQLQSVCPYRNHYNPIEEDNLRDVESDNYYGKLEPNTCPMAARNLENSVWKFNEETSMNPNMQTFLENYFDSKNDQLKCFEPPQNCEPSSIRYRSFDGSCNNLQYPGYGAANSRFSRMLPPNYADGVYEPSYSAAHEPLPNARQISLTVFGEQSYPDDYYTVAEMQWGQFVAHDLSEITTKGAPDDCCANAENKLCYPIELHPKGPIAQSEKKCLHFARSLSDMDIECYPSGVTYSEKISLSTAYLDLSFLYGNSVDACNKIRTHSMGQLKTSLINGRHHLPINRNENGKCSSDMDMCYDIPDPRNELIPTLALLHTLFLREHNRIANILYQINPHSSDEELFQEARRINIAQYQKITYYDWLPLTLGASYTYSKGLTHYSDEAEHINDYDGNVNAAVYAGFASAAFRYPHNKIPGFLLKLSADRIYNETLRLSESFNQAVHILRTDENFDGYTRGLITQLQKRGDTNIDVEIKHHLLQKAGEDFGTDLKSLDIQRGRDFGLPSYNDYREYCGLPRANHWSDFNHEISEDKIQMMQLLYAEPDHVELSVGGALESHLPESQVGPTFQCIMGKQFLKSRIGDRFFFEQNDEYSRFSKHQLAEIRKTSLASIICHNSDRIDYVQPNVFVTPNIKNPLQHCEHIPSVDLSKWQKQPTPEHYDEL